MSDPGEAIRTSRFTPSRLREGYDMGDVDRFLDTLLEAVEEGRPVAPLVADARFAVVRFREGYDFGEVDRLLAEVTAGGAPTATAPAEASPRHAGAPSTNGLQGLLALLRGR